MIQDIVIFISLCLLEVILGLDNIFSFAGLIHQLKPSERLKGKLFALFFAFLFRLALLSFALEIKKSTLIINLYFFKIPINQLFFFLGGVFLIYKSVQELIKIGSENHVKSFHSFWKVIAEIIFIDFVFSIDSVLAAIAVTSQMWIIACSIFASIVAIFYLTDYIMIKLEQSFEFQVLGFLIIGLVGLFLTAEGIGIHADKNILIGIILFSSLNEICLTFLKNKKKINNQTSQRN